MTVDLRRVYLLFFRDVEVRLASCELLSNLFDATLFITFLVRKQMSTGFGIPSTHIIDRDIGTGHAQTHKLTRHTGTDTCR